MQNFSSQYLVGTQGMGLGRSKLVDERNWVMGS